MIYSLSQIIENSASKFPDKEAFRFMDSAITYNELNTKSNQLAQQLISAGVQKGDRIGIYMNRCLETTIAVYGIMKAGAAYIPLDPFIPIARVLFMIDDCKMKHLITTPSQNKKIKLIANDAKSLHSIFGSDVDLKIPTISWETIFSTAVEDYKPVCLLGEDLAFLLYTSGSTGTPKAVMHTHQSGLALARLAADLYDFGPDDRIGNFAPLHFDPSTFGYFSVPLVGATTIIIPDAHLKFPASISELVVKEKITIWYSVPLMLIQILLKGNIEKHDFSSLRWVLFIGEVFITKHLRALMQKWPHARFSNLYGPVEVIACTYYHLDTPPPTNDPIPIGQVWGDTECKIIDSKDTVVKKGEIGELVVRTATMMKGYWNNEERTEKSWYKEKIDGGYEHVFYRTGDLAQENEEGLYLFHGRNDRQVKVRGYRLELDEIELTLLKNQHVEECAVVVLDNDTGVKEIIAVVRLMKDAEIDAETLTKFCKSHLPSYSIPETLKFLKEFPRTGSGKISRVEITRLLKEKEI
ncbi:MAG: amino acid adenylation domain-containing protein [Maribacter sp.]